MATTTHPWPHKACEKYVDKGGIFWRNWRINHPSLLPKKGHLEGEPTRSLGDNKKTIGNLTT